MYARPSVQKMYRKNNLERETVYPQSMGGNGVEEWGNETRHREEGEVTLC